MINELPNSPSKTSLKGLYDNWRKALFNYIRRQTKREINSQICDFANIQIQGFVPKFNNIGIQIIQFLDSALDREREREHTILKENEQNFDENTTTTTHKDITDTTIVPTTTINTKEVFTTASTTTATR